MVPISTVNDAKAESRGSHRLEGFPFIQLSDPRPPAATSGHPPQYLMQNFTGKVEQASKRGSPRLARRILQGRQEMHCHVRGALARGAIQMLPLGCGTGGDVSTNFLRSPGFVDCGSPPLLLPIQTLLLIFPFSHLNICTSRRQCISSRPRRSRRASRGLPLLLVPLYCGRKTSLEGNNSSSICRVIFLVYFLILSVKFCTRY